jgi:hypothetical protein
MLRISLVAGNVVKMKLLNNTNRFSDGRPYSRRNTAKNPDERNALQDLKILDMIAL